MIIKKIIFHLLFIILLCIIQVIIFNQISFLDYINFHIYTIFVFIYPIYESRFILIILSFFMGLIIDYYMNVGGINAFSITLISYVKQYILRFIAGKNIITGDDFSFFELSFFQKIYYTFTLMIIHYFAFFLLELFKSSNFKIILLRFISGVIFNTILCLIYLSIIEKNRS